MKFNLYLSLLICIGGLVDISLSFLHTPSATTKSRFRSFQEQKRNPSNDALGHNHGTYYPFQIYSLSQQSDQAQQQQNQLTPPKPQYYVRKARYMELGYVVDILIEAFYKPSALIKPYLYLSELSRLQGNFPYDNEIHTFFVACCGEKIIGFVDVDKRRGKKISDAPRPYLSDLAVHSGYRRMGVAKKLIRTCENESMRWGKDHLYLRVDKKNDAGLRMYAGLGYVEQEHPYFGVGKDTTILLKREFDQDEIDQIIKMQDIATCVETEENITYMI